MVSCVFDIIELLWYGVLVAGFRADVMCLSVKMSPEDRNKGNFLVMQPRLIIFSYFRGSGGVSCAKMRCLSVQVSPGESMSS
jgi:hypothetical protein